MSRSMIAEVLKERRRTHHLSTGAVIARLSEAGITLSPKSLYSYESGHRQPDADTLIALCGIYEIRDVLETFGYEKAKLVGVTTDELTENERIFMMLPPVLRQEAMRYMRYLVEQEGKL